MAEHQDLGELESDAVKATEMPRYRVTLSWPVTGAVVLLCLAIGIPNILLWRKLDRSQTERDKEHLFWVLCQPGYTNDQRSQAFSELMWQGNREWRSARLARLDLTGAQLRGADVQQAHMEGCNLSGADLAEAVLRQTQFDQADLSGSDLSGADLFEADLLKADLRESVLIRADLRGADMGQSNAAGAKFVSADMTGARLELAVLTNADLRLARLVGADLSLADLTSANLYRTDLSDAILSRTNLSNSNWWRAIGLSSDSIAAFKQSYPPSEDAVETLKQDYQQWLVEQEPQPTNRQSTPDSTVGGGQ